jgi:hypothetical protein
MRSSANMEETFLRKISMAVKKNSVLINDYKLSNMPNQIHKKEKNLFENYLTECFKNDNVLPLLDSLA